MDEFKNYMIDFKTKTLPEKKTIALEQLKVIASLTNKLCEELDVSNEVFITSDIVEAINDDSSEEDFVEGVITYASSIQNSLCDFIDKMTVILDKASRQ